VEYSSIVFAMFFLAEYSNMILMSAIWVLLFFGGWLGPFSLLSENILNNALPFWFCVKIVFTCLAIVMARATFPRYRYDQLMLIGWKIFLPIAFSFFFFLSGIIIAYDAIPC
jgi:NADH-quinone oxidoreductase subunit H